VLRPSTSVFVNRDRELDALHAAFDDTAAGHSRLVIVEGEGGIGKTTLIERFLSALGAAHIVRAGGDASESELEFALADQFLRAAGASADVLRAGRHLEVGVELLEVLSREQPTVAFVDDAHNADGASLRALLFAARRLIGCRALIILAVRGSAAEVLPEGWMKLAAGPGGTVVSVVPLVSADVLVLAGALGMSLSADAASRLQAHTNGNPLHIRAVLDALPDDEAWQHEHRPLPVPRSYGQLVRERLDRCAPEVIALIEATAVVGVQAPLHLAAALAGLEAPLDAVDAAIETGLIELDHGGPALGFTHPIARAAVYEALPNARRAALNARAAQLVADEHTALRHRVEATTLPDPSLVAELEAHAGRERSRGAWPSAIESLIAAGRLSPDPGERERLTLEAIEATMYSGDGAGARRLLAGARFEDGPRRDSVLAYLAIFAGDVTEAERLLRRAWEGRTRADHDRLSATIAMRSAFVAASRLRGREAVTWAERALALAPDDRGLPLLDAPSLAIGKSNRGDRAGAHAALDRWLDDPATPERAGGYILLALKGILALAEGDVAGARAAFETSAAESLRRGLLVVAALSLTGLTRVQYLAGEWDSAVVTSERAIALAVESDDQWVIAHARWRAGFVPAARGDLATAAAHVAAIREQAPTFERHVAAELIATAGLAAARERPAEVLSALAALERMDASDGVHDPAFLPWQHLKAQALVDLGRDEAADRFIASALALAAERANPVLSAQLTHARARLEFARGEAGAALASLAAARTLLEPLGAPYELALVELTEGQIRRRTGERRAAAQALSTAHARLIACRAEPALRRCEQELAACGLAPSARSSRDYAALTPQELAVARLVVAGMTNREVSDELMISTKTVEFHLGKIYAKLKIRSRSQLRARARADEIGL
jgi:DNA-binding CsgD family transcriptional regulator